LQSCKSAPPPSQTRSTPARGWPIWNTATELHKQFHVGTWSQTLLAFGAANKKTKASSRRQLHIAVFTLGVAQYGTVPAVIIFSPISSAHFLQTIWNTAKSTNPRNVSPSCSIIGQ
jgi:hypothetical protein